MRNRLIILLFVFGSLSLTSQNTYFNNLYDFNLGSDYGINVLPHDSGYLFSSGGSDSVWQEGLKYSVVTHQGKQIWSKQYVIAKHSVRTSKMIQLHDGNYLDARSLGFRDTSGVFRGWPRFVILKPNGDTVYTRHLKDSYSKHLAVRNIIQMQDSSFVLLCQNLKGNLRAEPIVYRLGSDFKVLKRSIVTSSGHEVLFSIDTFQSGGFVMSGFGGSGGGTNYFPFVMVMDSALNIVWRKWYPIRVDGAAMLTVDKDDNVVLGADSFHYESGGRYFTRKQMYKIDRSGNVIWRKSHGPLGGRTITLK